MRPQTLKIKFGTLKVNESAGFTSLQALRGGSCVYLGSLHSYPAKRKKGSGNRLEYSFRPMRKA